MEGDTQKEGKPKTSVEMTVLSTGLMTHVLLDGAIEREVMDYPLPPVSTGTALL